MVWWKELCLGKLGFSSVSVNQELSALKGAVPTPTSVSLPVQLCHEQRNMRTTTIPTLSLPSVWNNTQEHALPRD